MSEDYSRPYAIHSATECERLERQAVLANLPHHFRFLIVPPQARILDAGCGSGSMARLLASRHQHAHVVCIDLRMDYINYARERAAREGLHKHRVPAGGHLSLAFRRIDFRCRLVKVRSAMGQ
jgi:2-polyprenyl-3-methyl-5-hydroxy-6-metoxy-1,4-benzoquinol methylase